MRQLTETNFETPGLAACTDCEPGYYSSAIGSTSGCQFCPKGKYANKSGSSTCADCPAGRYGDKSTQVNESIACDLCAEGHYGDQPGATSRQCSGPCPVGSYSRPGALACKLCPEGRYGNVAGSGIVGYTTPVCSGECYGAAVGSTCCPPSRGWAGNCPGDQSQSPSPSSSSAPDSEAPTPSTPSSSGPAPALAIGLTVVALLAMTGAYFAYSKANEEPGRAAVHAADQSPKEDEVSQENKNKKDESNTALAKGPSQTRGAGRVMSNNANAMFNPSPFSAGPPLVAGSSPSANFGAPWVPPSSSPGAFAGNQQMMGGLGVQNYSNPNGVGFGTQSTNRVISQGLPVSQGFQSFGQSSNGAPISQGLQSFGQSCNGAPMSQGFQSFGQSSNGALSQGFQSFGQSSNGAMPQGFQSFGQGSNGGMSQGFGQGSIGRAPAAYANVGANLQGFRPMGATPRPISAQMLPSPAPSQQQGVNEQGSAAPRAARGRIYRTCQARIELWRQIMIKDGSTVKRGRKLGTGAYAEVYAGQALNGVDCAIKVYRTTASKRHRDEAMREIRLSASLDHPCTLRLLGWVQEPLQTITELCKGDLKAYYKDRIDDFAYTEMRTLQLLRVCFGLPLPLPVLLPASCSTHKHDVPTIPPTGDGRRPALFAQCQDHPS